MKELKSRTGKFFEVSAKMEEMQEDGSTKKIKRTIVVEADSFGEAEQTAMAEIVGAEVEIVSVGIAPYTEMFLSDNVNDENYYKAKLDFVTFDEKTQKEKHSKIVYLVQAQSLNVALRYIDDVMGKIMLDYENVGVVGTSIEDVYLKS